MGDGAAAGGQLRAARARRVTVRRRREAASEPVLGQKKKGEGEERRFRPARNFQEFPNLNNWQREKERKRKEKWEKKLKERCAK